MRKLVFKVAAVSIAGLAVLIALFVTVYEPWQRSWGATDEEVNRAMPGDEIVQNPTFNATRAVTIKGRPEEIWPWIVQIGYRKAGFYSHDWLDNDRIPSAERIIPEYQNLRIGDALPLTRTGDAEVKRLETNRLLLLVIDGHHGKQEPWSWAWGLYPQDDQHTRLVTRLRARIDSPFSNFCLDAFEIIMMRKHLLGIKRRVEAPFSGEVGSSG